MILVVGATGQLGGAITRRLLSAGASVRILARPTSVYQALEAAGAEVVLGDLKAPESLVAACLGVDHVVTTANAASRGGDDTVEAVDRQGTADLIAAAAAARVRQFVYLSAYGMRALANIPFAGAKIESEARLLLSGMNYTILQPAPFMESWIGVFVGIQIRDRGAVTIVGDGATRLPFVAQDDVADLAVAVLDHPKAARMMIPYSGGPPTSYREIVAEVERVIGRPVPIHTAGPGESIAGLPASMTQLVTLMDAGGDSTLDTTNVSRVFGLSPRTPLDFVRRHFSPPA
jgi:uncharacterized protein YbjT (DUF2867 family)